MPDNQAYVPDMVGKPWATLSAQEAGHDPAALQEAVNWAQASESPWPRSLYYDDGRYVGNVEWNESGPWSEIDGLVRPRGGPAGLVLKDGQLLAEWGDTARVDTTFSVAKSYLSLLTGLALGDGLIGSLDEPVSQRVTTGHFEGPHNSRISWRHLLTQTSEWDGILFGKSDQVDHFRQIGLGADNSRKGQLRQRQMPGSFYEYNDVRVNVLAFALLQVFRRPLPEILRERIMNPIGASDTWEWHGYETSWVDLDGKSIQSVSGGSHWGGGLFMSTRDHARLGLLVSRDGVWKDKRLLPEGWMKSSLTRSTLNPNYGLLWWLNTGGLMFDAAPHDSYFALGAGNNLIFVSPKDKIVAVIRWIDGAKSGGFIKRLMESCKGL